MGIGLPAEVERSRFEGALDVASDRGARLAAEEAPLRDEEERRQVEEELKIACSEQARLAAGGAPRREEEERTRIGAEWPSSSPAPVR